MQVDMKISQQRHRIEQNSFVGNIIVQLQMRKTDAEPYYKNCLVPAQR